MKRVPLRVKMAVAFVLITAAGFVVLSTFGRTLVKKQATNNTVNAMYHSAQSIAALYRESSSVLTHDSVRLIAAAMNYDVWITDLSGRVVASSDPKTESLVISDFRPADLSDGYYMSGRFYNTFAEDVLTVYAVLAHDAEARGFVLLHAPVSAVNVTADQMQLFAYLAFGAVMVLVLFLFLFIEFSVIRPIERVVTAGKEYANQNLSYPLPKVPHDEIGEIALAEQDLARQLQSAADDQHKFLQNISHDFRSPLTSIRGYMVAMQDGTIPPEMQGKYLDVVIGETDRLTTMANELLDVTQLENGVILDRTEFDLNDLIREVLPSFEGRAREKNVTFEVQFENAAQPVYADRPRIQQVIHNLIDNAIKFSGNDVTIDVSTHVSGGKVFTSVKDHGVGIEPENIKKIWNRFYKTDPSRGKDRKGTGLGLSIVRDIIQNHKENIDVISTPGVGSEFIFTLPAEEE
ncbi:MAG: HAMP domain-containing histidine kinase [Lachnospiraceae bacterium]|nr:HAMP domain-containing histidine kinase [Lachnospiraceae bacterium]